MRPNLFICLLFTAITLPFTIIAAETNNNIELVHIHGLAFDQQGKQLLIPAHFGIAVYEQGQWHKASGPDHDYMGFSVTRDAMYTSGHPGPGSSLVNPFGLKKSRDGGKNWQELGMQGESDFHTMASGYNTNVVYLLNMMPNRTLSERGLYYTLDDGQQWQRVRMTAAPEPLAIAVHPDDSATIAIAAREGLFLSNDHGQNFKQLDNSREVYAIAFDHDGQHLYYAGYDIGPSLIRLNMGNGKRITLTLPTLGRDAISFIAQNPINKKQLAIATFNRNVYLSNDAGKTWRQIALQGGTL